MLPKCAVLTCTNTADPRWIARDMNNLAVMICDGHDPFPKPYELALWLPPASTARELAERVVRNGYSPTPGEVVQIARALLADKSDA